MASHPSRTLMRQHRVEGLAAPAASLAPPPGRPRHRHAHQAFSDQVNKYLNVQNSYLGITHLGLQSICILEVYFLILEEFILRFQMMWIPFVYL